MGNRARGFCLRGWVGGFQEGDELVGELDEFVAVEGRGARGVVEGNACHFGAVEGVAWFGLSVLSCRACRVVMLRSWTDLSWTCTVEEKR